MKLITLQSPSHRTILVCAACNRAMDAGKISTPKDCTGQEYSNVSRGLSHFRHSVCVICCPATDSGENENEIF